MCNEFAQERAWREYSEMMQREALKIINPEQPDLPIGSIRPSARNPVASRRVRPITASEIAEPTDSRRTPSRRSSATDGVSGLAIRFSGRPQSATTREISCGCAR